MRKVIYAMMVSLDGFVAGPNGELDWHLVDEELHRHFNERESIIDMHLYGRGVYETMVDYWPTADEDPSSTPEYMVEYARIWREKPKVVFSKTLAKVDWNSRLVRDHIADEVMKLKNEPGHYMTVGGATLASSFLRYGLIDEFWMYVNPVVIGSGFPVFRDLQHIKNFQLIDTYTFKTGIVQLRYEVGKSL